MMPELGKYASTVLTAYGASILLLVGLVWVSLRSSRKAKADLDKVERQKNG